MHSLRSRSSYLRSGKEYRHQDVEQNSSPTRNSGVGAVSSPKKVTSDERSVTDRLTKNDEHNEGIQSNEVDSVRQNIRQLNSSFEEKPCGVGSWEVKEVCRDDLFYLNTIGEKDKDGDKMEHDSGDVIQMDTASKEDNDDDLEDDDSVSIIHSSLALDKNDDENVEDVQQTNTSFEIQRDNSNKIHVKMSEGQLWEVDEAPLNNSLFHEETVGDNDASVKMKDDSCDVEMVTITSSEEDKDDENDQDSQQTNISFDVKQGDRNEVHVRSTGRRSVQVRATHNNLFHMDTDGMKDGDVDSDDNKPTDNISHLFKDTISKKDSSSEDSSSDDDDEEEGEKGKKINDTVSKIDLIGKNSREQDASEESSSDDVDDEEEKGKKIGDSVSKIELVGKNGREQDSSEDSSSDDDDDDDEEEEKGKKMYSVSKIDLVGKNGRKQDSSEDSSSDDEEEEKGKKIDNIVSKIDPTGKNGRKQDASEDKDNGSHYKSSQTKCQLFQFDTVGKKDLVNKLDGDDDDDDDTDEDTNDEEDDVHNNLPAFKFEIPVKITETKKSRSELLDEREKDLFNWNKAYLDMQLDKGKGTFKMNEQARRFTRVDELMKKSVIIPGFEKLDAVPEYNESNRMLKKKRKQERERSKGSKWYNMPATEMTEELKRDLEVMQMRSILDPKHFYKKNDLKVLPKYFQVGKVKDNAVDFYNSRLPKKQRKRTIVDELLADADFKRYNKKKYTEIIQNTSRKRHKAHQKAKKLKRKK